MRCAGSRLVAGRRAFAPAHLFVLITSPCAPVPAGACCSALLEQVRESREHRAQEDHHTQRNRQRIVGDQTGLDLPQTLRHRADAVGDTVDRAKASYTNTIGAAQLATVWKDPEFNPAQTAFYYVRALEIPTPRHQVYDAVALGMNPADTAQPLRIQERAWSSPIWYTP